MSREALCLRLLSDAFGPLVLERDLQASKERHPATKPAVTYIPSLFDSPLPSHMGGKSTERTANPYNLQGLRLGVLGALVAAGDRGLTGTEADDAVNRPRPSGSSRLSELEEWGYVLPTTERRLSPSLRPQIVWKVTQAGVDAFEVASRLDREAS